MNEFEHDPARAVLLERPTGHLAELAGVLLATALDDHDAAGVDRVDQLLEVVAAPFVALTARHGIRAALHGDRLPGEVGMREQRANAEIEALVAVTHVIEGIVKVGDADFVPAFL